MADCGLGGITIESPLFWLGVLGFGIAHAFEPDHMAAVSAFVAGRPKPREAAAFGFKWALGHGFSLLILGSVLYLLKLAVNQPSIFASGVLEKVVGFVLIGLGVWMALQLSTSHVSFPGKLGMWLHKLNHHSHHHHHDHSHPHGHRHHHDENGKPIGPKHGSLWMGMLHGAAGTGAFVGQAAVTLALTTYTMTLLYTIIFSVGVLLAMSFYALLLGGVLTWSEHRSIKLLTGARWVTSIATCVIGVCLVKGVEMPGLFDPFMPH